MELELSNNINNVSNSIGERQQEFLETTLGKTINAAMDIGIKAVLPDIIENQVIDIKDAILENGFKEGIKEVINSAIDIGKSAVGIITGDFDNISQVQNVVKNGGLLDGVSDLLDFSIDLAQKNDFISSDISKVLKQGKNTIISSISDKVEETLTNQLKAVEKLESYSEKWNISYGNQDFDKMETAYKGIEKYLNEIIPFENIINNARKIENVHNLIKNNGHNFDISEEELKIAQKLI